MQVLLESIITLAEKAASAVMEIYRSDDFGVEHKSDESPLTKADMAAHNIICRGLKEISSFPILSEEDCDISWSERSQWQTFWLIDPVDGTKEFIKRNDEFTINIALIEEGRPILGVVLAPALDLVYAADEKQAFVIRDGQRRFLMASLPSVGETLRVVVSKSHRSQELEDYLSNLPRHEECAVGSSLKLCYLAEGLVHFGPRLGSISEWDIAAAHAILLASGCEIVELNSDKTLIYGKKSLATGSYKARVCGLPL